MAAVGPSLWLPACSPDILTESVGGPLLVSGLSLYLFTYFYFIIIIKIFILLLLLKFLLNLLQCCLFSCFGVFLWP